MDIISYKIGKGSGKGGSGTSGLKSISWTGTGTASHSITFPEKPTLLLALHGGSTGGDVQFVPIQYGCGLWNYVYANNYTQGAAGRCGLNYSADELTMTMTHSDGNGAAACNLSGVTYTLYYI